MSETVLSSEIGLLHQMWAPHGVADTELMAWATEEIQYAEELGFTSVWIGEHHCIRDSAPFYGRVPATEIFLSYLAARTTRINVGTGVKVLTTTSPQRAAEEMALVDLLADGRVEFGLGQGTAIHGQERFSREEKAQRFRTALLDVLQHLSPAGHPDSPPIAPSPRPELREKIWIAARDEPTITMAAELGLHLVVGQAERADAQSGYIETYRSASPTGQVRGVRIAFVAESDAEARRICESSVDLYYALLSQGPYFKEALARGAALPGDSFDAKRHSVHYIAGSPARVAEELNAYVAESRVDRLDVMMQLPLLSSEDVRSSMALFQHEVRPLLELQR